MRVQLRSLSVNISSGSNTGRNRDRRESRDRTSSLACITAALAHNKDIKEMRYLKWKYTSIVLGTIAVCAYITIGLGIVIGWL